MIHFNSTVFKLVQLKKMDIVKNTQVSIRVLQDCLV